ncbi:MAG TPA: ATP-binding protein, partial [Bacteroidales bacterium]
FIELTDCKLKTDAMNNRQMTKIQTFGYYIEFETMKSNQPFPFGLWIWYTVEEQHLWSESLYKLTGIDQDIRPNFQLWLEIIHCDDLPLFLNFIDKLLDGSKPCPLIFRITCPNKSVKKVECFAEVLTTGSPEIVDIAFLCSDITQNDNTIKQIATKPEITKSALFQERLFAVIAHDLKNSFNSVKGFSELLLTRLPCYNKQKIAQYIDKIHTSACNANTMLENLLHWTRVHNNGWNPVIEETDLTELVNEVIQQLNPTACYKQIRILEQVPENLKVFTDAEAVKIILRNLLSNAIKFSYKGKAVLIFVQAELNCIKVSVTDYGIGMTQNETEQIFNSSINVSKTGTENEKGTGIGISVCKELVEILGGRLCIESCKEKGTTVSFDLSR